MCDLTKPLAHHSPTHIRPDSTLMMRRKDKENAEGKAQRDFQPREKHKPIRACENTTSHQKKPHSKVYSHIGVYQTLSGEFCLGCIKLSHYDDSGHFISPEIIICCTGEEMESLH